MRYAVLHALKHKLDRIIFIIPFTSIIEQNAQAVKDLFESESELQDMVLEHHSSIEPEMQTWQSKIYTENWELPIVFTTSVQVLESLFSGGTRGIRRLHTMANAILVFDEIQAIPYKCIRLFCHAINFLNGQCGSTVILCSATQPTLDKLPKSERGSLNLAQIHEIMSAPETLYNSLKRVSVVPLIKPNGYSIDESSELILDKFTQAKSCLVIGIQKNGSKISTYNAQKKWIRTLFSI